MNNDFGAPFLNSGCAFITRRRIEPVGNATGARPSSARGSRSSTRTPKSRSRRWQIGMQRELPGQWVFEAAYVGNYGYDIEITRNINAPPIQYLNTDNSRTAAMDASNTFLSGAVANPFAGLVPGTGFNNATISRSQLLLPYPSSGPSTRPTTMASRGTTPRQFGLQKRFSKGYTFGLAYTRSKWMQATEDPNAADPTPTKMISDLDVTNRLSLSGIYALPFGRGRSSAGVGPLTDALIGGWQLQGVYTYQTGFPVAFGSDGFYSGADVAIEQPDPPEVVQHRRLHADLWSPTGTLSTPVNHLRTLPLRFSDVRTGSRRQRRPVWCLEEREVPRRHEPASCGLEFIDLLDEPVASRPRSPPPTSATFGRSLAAANQTRTTPGARRSASG